MLRFSTIQLTVIVSPSVAVVGAVTVVGRRSAPEKATSRSRPVVVCVSVTPEGSPEKAANEPVVLANDMTW